MNYRGYIINVHDRKEELENPRTLDYTGSVMLCSHYNYKLGDIQIPSEYTSPKEYATALEGVNADDIISLPLYLYDHSGLTISTTPFTCQYDSGLLGIIYITKEQAKQSFKAEDITDKVKEEILEALNRQVEDYSEYVNNSTIYEYIAIISKNIDCTCGHTDEEGAISEAKQLIDNIIKEEKCMKREI